VSKCKKTVEHVAGEIEHYFSSHPEAADSQEGITKWWITRQRLHENLTVVRAALDRLVSKGRIIKITNRDGTTIYKKP
jgi:hypothetical protein